MRASIKGAWAAFNEPIKARLAEALGLIDAVQQSSPQAEAVAALRQELSSSIDPTHHTVVRAARRILHLVKDEQSSAVEALTRWTRQAMQELSHTYNSNLYSETPYAADRVPVVPAEYADDAPLKNGFEVLNACFDTHLANNPAVVAFGEDVGQIGDVNQGFAGLQDKHG